MLVIEELAKNAPTLTCAPAAPHAAAAQLHARVAGLLVLEVDAERLRGLI